MFHTMQECFGRLDFFISTDGPSAFQPLMRLEPDGLERSFNVNVRAFVLGAQGAVRLMDRGGRIVALSGYGSQYAFPTGANLGSAHAAVEEWARHIAVELAPLGINVNVLMLGVIASDSASGMCNTGLATPLNPVEPLIPKRRPGFVDEAADCALFLLSPASEYVTGTTVVVDGGLTAAVPAVHSDLAPG
jgi:enoyl-[acyl-carrier protein] reductase III